MKYEDFLMRISLTCAAALMVAGTALVVVGCVVIIQHLIGG